jgi:hypothetical protein
MPFYSGSVNLSTGNPKKFRVAVPRERTANVPLFLAASLLIPTPSIALNIECLLGWVPASEPLGFANAIPIVDKAGIAGALKLRHLPTAPY